ncbi:hypothetical protein [Telluribacter sp. SYSU D00476]|uniref:hypothetical protein n=1 Tax=Telluribacter sp. SYSU D00476 TaxID=2811430 RepID=UPI001FF173FF|nr:hypothetical protein [Telluribacter sp. SYSU D00476]
MKQILLLISISILLSSCLIQIDLQKRDLPIQDQDLPYKRYLMLGNTCVAADGTLATVMLRKASNNSPGAIAPTYPWLEQYQVVVVKTSLTGQTLWEALAYTSVSMTEQRPLIHPLSDGSFWVFTIPFEWVSTPRVEQTSALVLRLDAQGKVLEKQQASLPYYPTTFTPDRILSLPDEGFVVAGRMRTRDGDPVPAIVRYSKEGQIRWHKTYPESIISSDPIGLTPTPENGFLLSWHEWNQNENIDQTYILKTDANGSQLWSRKYSLFASRFACPRPGGGYLLQATQTHNQKNIFQCTLSETGDLQRVKNYPLSEGQSNVTPLGIFSSASTATAVYSLNGNNIHLLVTDQSGQEIARNQVYGHSFVGAWVEVLPFPDGTLNLTGRDRFGTFLLALAKPDGNVLWSHPIPAQK